MEELATLPDEHADTAMSAPNARAVLGMPFGKGEVADGCFFTIMRALEGFGRDRVRFIRESHTLVDEARNRLATRFVRNFDHEFLIMVDDDLAVPFGNAAQWNAEFRRNMPPIPERKSGQNFFQRLLSHPADKLIVGGAYFDRKVGGSLQCAHGVGPLTVPNFNDRYRAGQLRGLIPMQWVATGAIRIHRSVFTQMIERADELFPEIKPAKGGDKGFWGFFIKDRNQQGEDVAFAARAQRLGITSWLDCELHCGHRSLDVYY